MKKALNLIILIILALVLLFSACDVTHDTPLVSESWNGFVIYYIDVGQADSALVVCDGEAMLIDGGNAADSSLIYSFLQRHDIGHLEYIVATHAHEDHVGGLAGALNYATVSVALSPVTEYDSRAFGNFAKYLNEQGVAITVPSPGDSFKLGSADVLILGPINSSSNTNNTSIVMMITYGTTRFLFTGDAERDLERDIVDTWTDISATVLKVAHHGSETSTTYPFLREVMPEYAVISCGSGNSYGHPHDDTMSRLRDAEVAVYRTDMQGIITCVSDGSTISFTVERNEGAITNPTLQSTPDEEAYYIGNINSKKLHRPSCSGLPNESNRVIFNTYDEAIEAGYDPCGNCLRS